MAGTAIDGGDGDRNTSVNTPLRSRNVVTKSAVKGSPPKTALSVRGTSPPKPTPRIGEEGVVSPQAFKR